jgi:Fe-S-cluster-containing dehydrogenase component
MSGFSRRDFLRTCGGTGLAVAATAAPVEARTPPKVPADAVGMLYDTTLCIGCKACVVACTDANDLIPDTALSGGLWQTPTSLNSQTKNIIKLYQGETDWSFVKQQCMHCLDPACVAGCPFQALMKGDKGIVTWNPKQCIGCRYCEIVCPFKIPKFEWTKFNPKIVKCQMCDHRLDEFSQPACTQVCPTGAVTFGQRTMLLDEAKRRITEKPGTYHEDRVYGEKDGGGTQVLYLSHVPFAAIGLPTLSDKSLPSYGSKVHQIMWKWMLFPIALYAFFVTLVRKNWKEHDKEAMQAETEQGLRDQL